MVIQGYINREVGIHGFALFHVWPSRKRRRPTEPWVVASKGWLIKARSYQEAAQIGLAVLQEEWHDKIRLCPHKYLRVGFHTQPEEGIGLVLYTSQTELIYHINPRTGTLKQAATRLGKSSSWPTGY